MAALIDLCNRALAMIAAGQIADLDEGSLESREAKRFGVPLLAEVADWGEAPWSWLRKRVVLASVPNDRPAEWLYAYATPADMAQPIAIRRVEDAATDLPIAGPYPFPLQDAIPLAFIVEGGRIYANVPTPTLIYSTSLMDAGQMPPLVARAFELELAARIALPIKKDAQVARALFQQAEIAKARAMADEQNKQPQPAPRYTSEVEMARAGYGEYM